MSAKGKRKERKPKSSIAPDTIPTTLKRGTTVAILDGRLNAGLFFFSFSVGLLVEKRAVALQSRRAHDRLRSLTNMKGKYLFDTTAEVEGLSVTANVTELDPFKHLKAYNKKMGEGSGWRVDPENAGYYYFEIEVHAVENAVLGVGLAQEYFVPSNQEARIVGHSENTFAWHSDDGSIWADKKCVGFDDSIQEVEYIQYQNQDADADANADDDDKTIRIGVGMIARSGVVFFTYKKLIQFTSAVIDNTYLSYVPTISALHNNNGSEAGTVKFTIVEDVAEYSKDLPGFAIFPQYSSEILYTETPGNLSELLITSISTSSTNRNVVFVPTPRPTEAWAHVLEDKMRLAALKHKQIMHHICDEIEQSEALEPEINALEARVNEEFHGNKWEDFYVEFTITHLGVGAEDEEDDDDPNNPSNPADVVANAQPVQGGDIELGDIKAPAKKKTVVNKRVVIPAEVTVGVGGLSYSKYLAGVDCPAVGQVERPSYKKVPNVGYTNSGSTRKNGSVEDVSVLPRFGDNCTWSEDQFFVENVQSMVYDDEANLQINFDEPNTLAGLAKIKKKRDTIGVGIIGKDIFMTYNGELLPDVDHEQLLSSHTRHMRTILSISGPAQVLVDLEPPSETLNRIRGFSDKYFQGNVAQLLSVDVMPQTSKPCELGFIPFGSGDSGLLFTRYAHKISVNYVEGGSQAGRLYGRVGERDDGGYVENREEGLTVTLDPCFADDEGDHPDQLATPRFHKGDPQDPTRMIVIGKAGENSIGLKDDYVFVGYADGAVAMFKLTDPRSDPELSKARTFKLNQIDGVSDAHGDSVSCMIAFKAYGSPYLATGSWDGTVCVFAIDEGGVDKFKLINRLEAHSGAIRSLCYDDSSDVFRLFSGSLDTTIRMWPNCLAPSPPDPVTFDDPEGSVTSLLVFNSNSKTYLFAGTHGEYGEALLIDVDSRKLVKLFTFKSEVTCIEYAPAARQKEGGGGSSKFPKHWLFVATRSGHVIKFLFDEGLRAKLDAEKAQDNVVKNSRASRNSKRKKQESVTVTAVPTFQKFVIVGALGDDVSERTKRHSAITFMQNSPRTGYIIAFSGSRGVYRIDPDSNQPADVAHQLLKNYGFENFDADQIAPEDVESASIGNLLLCERYIFLQTRSALRLLDANKLSIVRYRPRTQNQEDEEEEDDFLNPTQGQGGKTEDIMSDDDAVENGIYDPSMKNDDLVACYYPVTEELSESDVAWERVIERAEELALPSDPVDEPIDRPADRPAGVKPAAKNGAGINTLQQLRFCVEHFKADANDLARFTVPFMAFLKRSTWDPYEMVQSGPRLPTLVNQTTQDLYLHSLSNLRPLRQQEEVNNLFSARSRGNIALNLKKFFFEACAMSSISLMKSCQDATTGSLFDMVDAETGKRGWAFLQESTSPSREAALIWYANHPNSNFYDPIRTSQKDKFEKTDDNIMQALLRECYESTNLSRACSNLRVVRELCKIYADKPSKGERIHNSLKGAAKRDVPFYLRRQQSNQAKAYDWALMVHADAKERLTDTATATRMGTLSSTESFERTKEYFSLASEVLFDYVLENLAVQHKRKSFSVSAFFTQLIPYLFYLLILSVVAFGFGLNTNSKHDPNDALLTGAVQDFMNANAKFDGLLGASDIQKWTQKNMLPNFYDPASLGLNSIGDGFTFQVRSPGIYYVNLDVSSGTAACERSTFAGNLENNSGQTITCFSESFKANSSVKGNLNGIRPPKLPYLTLDNYDWDQGFYYDLTENQTVAANTLALIAYDQLRVITFVASFYSPTLNQFSAAQIAFERTGSGGFNVFVEANTVMLEELETGGKRVALDIVLVVMVFVLFVFNELKEIFTALTHKVFIKSYLSDFWNFYEWSIIGLFIAVYVLKLEEYTLETDFQKYVDQNAFLYSAQLAAQQRYIFGCIIAFSYMRILKFFSIPYFSGPNVRSFLSTLKGRPVVVFSLFWVTVVLAWTFAFHVGFSASGSDSFKVLGSSFLSVFFIMTGDHGSYDSIANVSPWSTTFFLFTLLIGGTLLLNLFIGIIADTYNTALEAAQIDYVRDLNALHVAWARTKLGRTTLNTRIKKKLAALFCGCCGPKEEAPASSSETAAPTKFEDDDDGDDQEAARSLDLTSLNSPSTFLEEELKAISSSNILYTVRALETWERQMIVQRSEKTGQEVFDSVQEVNSKVSEVRSNLNSDVTTITNELHDKIEKKIDELSYMLSSLDDEITRIKTHLKVPEDPEEQEQQ